MRSVRSRVWVVALAAVWVGRSSPTEVSPRFELGDGWEGTFRTHTRAVAVRLDLVTTGGAALGGTAQLDGADFEVVGRYEPPTVWVKIFAPGTTVEFVGEMLTSGLINGSVVSTQEELLEVGRLTLVRR